MNSSGASEKPSSAATPKQDLAASQREKQALPADPFSPAQLKSMGLRIGIPTLIAWAIAFAIPGWIPKVVVGVLTLALAGVVASRGISLEPDARTGLRKSIEMTLAVHALGCIALVVCTLAR